MLSDFKISTHTPVRVWHYFQRNSPANRRFQLTHPWGCDRFTVCRQHWPYHFNLHTREGVTAGNEGRHHVFGWFQLTHPWGCDQSKKKRTQLQNHFNSHTREGVTLRRSGVDIYTIQISTHTPVRVWQSLNVSISLKSEFQLTHPWGCDASLDEMTEKDKDFNSHTREGVTVWWTYIRTEKLYFNSHTREGVTSQIAAHAASNGIFQLTHPWGCDYSSRPSRDLKEISTHTPVRVWRTGEIWMLSKACNFNSHTREGVTMKLCRIMNVFAFQLTHPWGCDSVEMVNSRPVVISTHTPVRVWQYRHKG